jgi:hypothetical protein
MMRYFFKECCKIRVYQENPLQISTEEESGPRLEPLEGGVYQNDFRIRPRIQ